MANKKKQHYVPKFLMRNFSTDPKRKLLNLYNVNSDFYKANCPLDPQGKEDYFYGKDGQIEDELGKLENKVAPIISSIILNKSIPIRDTELDVLLFLFSMFLAHRTKESAEQLNEVVDQMLKNIISLDSSFEHINTTDIHFQLNNPASYSLSIVAQKILQSYDLKLKLIINKTTIKFITSDHPAVLYNQFLESRNHPGGHLGMFSKGLQMFFPISPDCMLVYYDNWAYKIGNKRDKVVYSENSKDITQLNQLQLINCTEMVFTNNEIQEFEIQQMSEFVKKYRNKEKSTLYKTNQENLDEEGLERLTFIQHRVHQKIKLKLSFIKQPQHVKLHKLSDQIVQVRKKEHLN